MHLYIQGKLREAKKLFLMHYQTKTNKKKGKKKETKFLASLMCETW